MDDATPRRERVELADETIADLTAEGDVVGGRRAIFTDPCVQTDDDLTCGPDGGCVFWPPPRCED